MRFVGVLPLSESGPCFVTPLYHGADDRFYIHEANAEGLIEEFHEVSDHEELGKLRPVSMEWKPATKGASALYLFQLPTKELLYGTKYELKSKLARKLSALNKFPFVRLEAAAFIGDRNSVRMSVLRATQKLADTDPQCAVSWYKYIAKKLALRQDEISDDISRSFCHALLGFHRVYLQMLHVSAAARRTYLENLYKDRFRLVLYHLFDELFAEAIDADLNRIQSKPLQLELRFDGDRVEGMSKLLTNFGISGSRARKFLSSTYPNRAHSLANSAFENLAKSLTDADQRLKEELEFSRTLGKVEKKIRKGDLSYSASSISYGLILLISAESDLRRIPNDYYSTKLIALTALESGLRNLDYSFSEDDQFHNNWQRIGWSIKIKKH